MDHRIRLPARQLQSRLPHDRRSKADRNGLCRRTPIRGVRVFFYITNESSTGCSSRQIVFGANERCDQENTISQLHASGTLATPLDNLTSNGAYMANASLAWSLKCWSGLMIRPEGTTAQKQHQRDTRHRLLRMEFHTFLQTVIQIPARIICTSRRLIYRLLTFRCTAEIVFMLFEHTARPLRC